MSTSEFRVMLYYEVYTADRMPLSFGWLS